MFSPYISFCFLLCYNIHVICWLIFLGEREKRKDSLLQLTRSKQERTEVELKQLRKVIIYVIFFCDKSTDFENLLLYFVGNVSNESLNINCIGDFCLSKNFFFLFSFMKVYRTKIFQWNRICINKTMSM